MCSIAVGSRVKLKAGVQPTYGWGAMDQDECGIVESIDGENVMINFAEHQGWEGLIHEMELDETWSPEAVVRQEPQVTVTVSLPSGRSAEITATAAQFSARSGRRQPPSWGSVS